MCFFTYYASPINLSLLQIMGLLQNISPSNIPGFSGTWQQDLIVDQTETLNSQTFLNNGYNGNIEWVITILERKQKEKVIPMIIKNILAWPIEKNIIWHKTHHSTATIHRKTITKTTVANLLAARNQISAIDMKILNLLAERMKASESIAEIKSRSGVESLSLSQWRKMLKNLQQIWLELWISPSLVTSIYSHIHLASLETQKKYRSKK